MRAYRLFWHILFISVCLHMGLFCYICGVPTAQRGPNCWMAQIKKKTILVERIGLEIVLG